MKTSLKSFAALVVGIMGMGAGSTALVAGNSTKEGVISEVFNATTIKWLVFKIVNSWKSC